MNKINIVAILFCAYFSYIYTMDAPTPSLSLPARQELTYFITRNGENLDNRTDDSLNPDALLHIKAAQRVAGNLHDKNKYQGNTFDGHPYIFYQNTVAYSGNNCLGLFFSTDKEYKLPISDEVQKIEPVKSISFNQAGDTIAAINSTSMFVWNIKEQPTLLHKDTIKQTKEITRTLELVSLNNTGNLLATTIRENVLNPSSDSHSYAISILDLANKSVLFNVDLESLCCQLYFINDYQLLTDLCIYKKIFNLEKSRRIIEALTPQQIIALETIYNKQQQVLQDQKANGFWSPIKTIALEKDDIHYETIVHLPEIVKNWARTIVSIQGEKQDCIIS